MPSSLTCLQFKQRFSPGWQPLYQLLRALCTLAFCLGLAGAAVAGEPGGKRVSVLLNWKHQFEFAAFYAALEQGYYRQAGLDVRILEGGPSVDVVREVVEGRADFGVGTSSLVVERYRDRPVVAVATLMQHSATGLLALRKSGITSIHDLSAQPIAVDPHSRDEIEAYLRASGIPQSNIHLVDQLDWTLDSLNKGLVAAKTIYTSNEAYFIRGREHEYLMLSPRSAGIDLFGNMLFTTDTMAKTQHATVVAFRDATLKGMVYALDHAEATVDLILAKYNTQGKSRDHLLFEARQIKELTRADIIEPGYMSLGRWRHVVDVYASQGQLPRDFDLSNFLFDEKKQALPDWAKWLLVAAIGGLMVALAFVFKVRQLNHKLQGQMAERLRAEEAALVSEAKYRELVENASAIILRMGMDGTVTYFNEYAEKFFGYRAEEILGRHVVGTIVPRRESDTDRDLLALMDAIIADPIRYQSNENENITRSGQRVFIHWTNRVVADEDGKPSGVLSIGQDITAKKLAELELDRHRHQLEQLVEDRTASLRAAEQRSQLILDTSANGLYGLDYEGRFTFVNPAGAAMLGYSQEALIGKHAHVTIHHTHEDGSPFPPETCPMLGVLHTQAAAINDDDLFWCADGQPLPVATAAQAMFKDGAVVGIVVSFVDIRQRKTMDKARDEALRQAEHLARVKSEFLANMSHEIRTPLNGILGMAHVGLRHYAEPPRVEEAFNTILRSGNQLLGVVNDVLDFSKIEAGMFRIEAAHIDLDQVVEESLMLLRGRAEAKGLSLIYQRDPDLAPGLMGDPLRLGQVLTNLVSNAIKFTEAGKVTVAATRAGESLLLQVRDTGMGISTDHLQRIFDPFEQADGSTTRKFGGTGLGLAITHRIVGLMGGQIRVSSQLNAGSTFEVELPYVAAHGPFPVPEEAMAQGDLPLGQQLSGLRILVAEDNEINQMVLEENLIDEGAMVVMVADGQQAVDQVREHGGQYFDVVLMDIQMPVMNGHQATLEILALAPDLPVVGQTAHAFEEEKAACLASGMVAHLSKPINPALLVQTILHYLRPKSA